MSRIYQEESLGDRLQAFRDWANTAPGFSVLIGLADVVLVANLARLVLFR